MQWSLKSLLIAVAVLPIAAYALYKSTPIFVSSVVTIAGAMWIATAIMAWCAEERSKTWARGVFVGATAYGLLVYTLGNEITLSSPRLATSHLLAYVYTLVPQENVVQPQQVLTTNPYPGYVSGTVVLQSSPPWVATGTGTGMPAAVTWSPFQLPSPAPQDFGAIGHIYWGVLIGLIGGWFALFLERRRSPEKTAD